MNKVVIILLLLIVVIASVVSASVYVQVNAAKTQIVKVYADENGWNNGFRDSNDIVSCKQYLSQMSDDARMECLGFKAIN